MSKALHRTGGRRSILDWWGSADQHENAIMFGGGFVWLIYFGDAYPLTQRAERTPEGLPLLLLCPTNVAQLAHLRLVKLATFLPFLATLLLLFVLLSLLFLLALFFLVLFFLSLPTLLSFPVLLALFSLPLALFFLLLLFLLLGLFLFLLLLLFARALLLAPFLAPRFLYVAVQGGLKGFGLGRKGKKP